MTSQEIFRTVNPQAMLEQERQKKLKEAQTGISKQMILSGAIQQNMMGQQPMGQMPQQTTPQGWGRTA